jgi:diguanylate cyclase (GGDEF)-like protein
MKADPTAAHEALVQFMYQAPIGLLQAASDGEITMINPMSAQLLMPLARDGQLVNLFDVLADVAPGLRAQAAAHGPAPGVICESLRFTLGGTGPRGEPPPTLAIHLRRLEDRSLMASVSDVTLAVQQEQQRIASQLRDLTRTDALTAMPNRAVIVEHLAQLLQRANADPDDEFAVLFVNCDRFNHVNVTLGAAAGDELLRLMAARLNGTVRGGDAVGRATPPTQTAGRLGGDEFVVVLEGLRHADDVHAVAQRLIDTLGKPYGIGEHQVHAGASIGIVLRAQAGADADTVLQDASIAMREAKRAGGARYVVFEPPMKQRAARRGSLESELRQALAEGQLFVVYQPIVDLAAGHCAGVEALVRWAHPVRGTVSPVEFIGIAEETGLIGPLGRFVLQTACLQFGHWQRTLGAQAPRLLSVNLSRAQLAEPTLPQQVQQALQAGGVEAGRLQLEVTESLAAQDEGVQARLHELKALGLTLALDDFGTGYSSLASLHQLPVDVVKIDRSFVCQLESSAHHRVLVEATVSVARSLGMRTVAEGIETEGEAALLAELQCEKGQGYLFAPPLATEAATDWLARHQRAGAAATAPAAAAVPTEKLLECLGQSPIAVALFDPQERLAYANRSFLQAHWNGLDGLPTWEEIMRQAHRRRRGVLIDSDDIEGWLAQVRQRYRQQPHRVFESDMTDGRWMRVSEETFADGWQLTMCTDVSSLKGHEAELRRARDAAMLAAVTDPLTELPNRRHVFERLAQLMTEAAELRYPLTVAAIDLDEFKAINDSRGHAVGDQVLVCFARELQAALRPRDAVGRIGGEEFLLVLANTGRVGAERVLGELRERMADAPRVCRLPLSRVGFSAGIVEVRPGESIESVVQRADQGLYLAKGAGRGRDVFVSAADGVDAPPALRRSEPAPA